MKISLSSLEPSSVKYNLREFHHTICKESNEGIFFHMTFTTENSNLLQGKQMQLSELTCQDD